MKFHGEQRLFFLVALSLVTVAFIAILLPFYSALLWAVILALLFAPMNRWLLARFNGRENLAALLTLSAVLLIVILPVVGISMSLVSEATDLYARVRSGQLDFGRYLGQIIDALPGWARRLLDDQGLLDVRSIQQRLAESAASIGQMLASQAVGIGQNTVHLLASTGILLYVLFFLLRDGGSLVRTVRKGIPLEDDHTFHLAGKFTAVSKATVKGNVAVALAQGALGGLILWFLGIQGALLWGVVMAFLSLLPAVGAGLIWAPIAIYFLATGAIWQGVVLIAWGVFVIGLVDNLLRPILVGKDTKMPDYVVLVSTVGGMSLFGLNGFVIGPMVAALFIAAWDLYVSPDKVREEVREEIEAAVEAEEQEAAAEAEAAALAAAEVAVDAAASAVSDASAAAEAAKAAEASAEQAAASAAASAADAAAAAGEVRR